MDINKIFYKARPILLWLVALYFAEMFGKHGYFKFDPDGFWSPAFNRWGYPGWFRVFIGILELGGAILLLIPRTMMFGGFILAVVMVGAFLTRSIHGASATDLVSIAFYCMAMLYIGVNHYLIRQEKVKPA